MEKMAEPEVQEFILHNRFGVLSLSDEGNSYAVPIYYGYDGRRFYFATRPGTKDRYIERTREACLSIVRVHSLDEWASVHVFGKLEKLDGELDASEALLRVPLPPDWGESDLGEPNRTGAGAATYRLTPTRVSGRHSEHAPEALEERGMVFGGM